MPTYPWASAPPRCGASGGGTSYRFALTVVVAVVPWVAALAACGGDGIGPPRVSPPSSTVPDERFVIEGVPYSWLIGNDLTPGENTISIAVTAPAETEVVDVWVARGPGQR